MAVVSIPAPGACKNFRVGRSSSLAWGALGLLAAVGGYSCTELDVTAVEVGRIQVTPSKASLFPGGTMRLDVEVEDGDGRSLLDRAIAWETTNPGVVTVSPQGVTTAVGEGNATVLASAEGVIGWAVVTVGRGPAPTGLTATPISSSQINLSWTDTSAGNDEYWLERSSNAGRTWPSKYGPLAGNTTSYQNTKVIDDTRYTYRVRACETAETLCSPYSNEASATTPEKDGKSGEKDKKKNGRRG